MKIRPVEAKSFHADEWTDRRKDGQDAANSRFLQFSEDTIISLWFWITFQEPEI
jgi:hypothetical protein